MGQYGREHLSMNLGMIISPTAYKKNGEEWCAKHPVGTGPFQFVSWEKDVRTTYKKFPGYWQKGKPYLDRVEWTPISDTLTRQLSFRRGEQDLMLSVPQKDVAAIEKDGYTIARQRVGSGAVSLIPDSANPKSPWADLRVRQAAQYAIDGAALVKSVYYGEGEVTNQWIYKASWAYNPSVVGYPYNPAKARQLLASAGYPNGFKTKLLYRTNPQDDQLFTAVQGFLQAVGIQAELDPAQTARYNQISSQGAKLGRSRRRCPQTKPRRHGCARPAIYGRGQDLRLHGSARRLPERNSKGDHGPGLQGEAEMDEGSSQTDGRQALSPDHAPLPHRVGGEPEVSSQSRI